MVDLGAILLAAMSLTHQARRALIREATKRPKIILKV
jgi:hypothetical protein